MLSMWPSGAAMSKFCTMPWCSYICSNSIATAATVVILPEPTMFPTTAHAQQSIPAFFPPCAHSPVTAAFAKADPPHVSQHKPLVASPPSLELGTPEMRMSGVGVQQHQWALPRQRGSEGCSSGGRGYTRWPTHTLSNL